MTSKKNRKTAEQRLEELSARCAKLKKSVSDLRSRNSELLNRERTARKKAQSLSDIVGAHTSDLVPFVCAADVGFARAADLCDRIGLLRAKMLAFRSVTELEEAYRDALRELEGRFDVHSVSFVIRNPELGEALCTLLPKFIVSRDSEQAMNFVTRNRAGVDAAAEEDVEEVA